MKNSSFSSDWKTGEVDTVLWPLIIEKLLRGKSCLSLFCDKSRMLNYKIKWKIKVSVVKGNRYSCFNSLRKGLRSQVFIYAS